VVQGVTYLEASDIAYFAAKDAIKISGIDKESFDYIIVAIISGMYKLISRGRILSPAWQQELKTS
jgi:3-oxoacyl-[acyl-carrier-protein] synthase-3